MIKYFKFYNPKGLKSNKINIKTCKRTIVLTLKSAYFTRKSHYWKTLHYWDHCKKVWVCKTWTYNPKEWIKRSLRSRPSWSSRCPRRRRTWPPSSSRRPRCASSVRATYSKDTILKNVLYVIHLFICLFVCGGPYIRFSNK